MRSGVGMRAVNVYKVDERKPQNGELVVVLDDGFNGFTLTEGSVEYAWLCLDAFGDPTGTTIPYGDVDERNCDDIPARLIYFVNGVALKDASEYILMDDMVGAASRADLPETASNGQRDVHNPYPPRRWEYIGKLNAVKSNGCGFAAGDIVIADSWGDGTAAIRPEGQLWPTLLSIPERFIDRIYNAESKVSE